MVIPVILEKELDEIKRKAQLVDSLAEFIQIDVADGVLVNGLTYQNVDDLEDLGVKAKIELHFMVADPLKYLSRKLKNVERVCTQVESQSTAEFLQKAKDLGYEAGVSMAPATPVEAFEPFLQSADYVQFVSVEPGAQSRTFDEDVLEKIKRFHERHPDMRIQVDGGVNVHNMDEVLKAGANDVVIGSAIFNSSHMQTANLPVNPIVGVSRNATSLGNSTTKIKRIAFLGGAHWDPNEQPYKDAYEVAKVLASAGYQVVNGGGPGVMEAATQGAHDAGKRALAVTYHPNKPKRHYEGVYTGNNFDEEIITLDYFDRTKVMLQTTEAHIVFKGSIGTLSELGMSWISSWIHEPNSKPIILFGAFWEDFLNLMKKDFLIVKGEENIMKICTTPQEVLEYIQSLG